MRSMRILGLLALAAASLAAQQPSRPDSMKRPMMPEMMGQVMGQGMMGRGMMGQGMMGHMMQMHQMMAPMMRGMAFAPDHLLNRKDALELTAAQVTRLTAIRDAAKAAHDAAQAEHKTHLDAVVQAMKAAAPDTNAMKTHFQAAHAAGGRAHWVMLSAAAQARAVLNDTQRGRVEGWTEAMMMHQGQRMQGMMQMRQQRQEEHHPDRP